jgi:ribonuclease HII
LQIPKIKMGSGSFLIAGVDEAGRGPLAGPVVVAAVILPVNYALDSLDDSKRLSASRRERLVPMIEAQAIAYAVEFIDVEEIDRVNILQATLNGMQRAVESLDPAPQRAMIDGNRAPSLSCEVETVIGGDGLIASISAASILAKVYRDRLMLTMHDEYPGYGFDRHKGYPTAHHLACLKTLGPCPIHRRSFAPVRKAIAEPGTHS